MDNIFITTLSAPMDGWLAAFPDLTVVGNVSALVEMPLGATVWLHQVSNQPADLQQILQSVSQIRQDYPSLKVIVLSNQPDNAQVLALVQAGAMGCSHAYAAPEQLTKVQHVVAEGGLWLGEQVVQQLIQSAQEKVGNRPITVDTLLAKLTRREQQVAQEVAKGLSNKEIARTLEITERTVKAHMASIFERLSVKDRLQLALMLTQKD